MARRPGDLIQQRWRVERELPPLPGLRRLAAVDTVTGENVEIAEANARSRLLPGAEAAMARTAQRAPTHPAVLPRVVLPTEDGTCLLSVPQAGTLADVTDRMGPDQARDLARWLGPALLAMADPPAGRLLPEEVVLDPAGVPRLALTGIPSAATAIKANPYEAPETARRGPGPGGGLYGLGVILYQGLTGTLPVAAAGSVAPVPPSVLRPQVPAATDRLVLDLLSHDPSRRVTAIQALEPWSGSPPSLPLPVQLPALPSRQVPGVHRPVPRRFQGPWFVQAHPTPPGRSGMALLAARTGLEPASLTAAMERGQPVVVAGLPSETEAGKLAAALERHGIRAEVTTSTGAARSVLWFLSFLTLATAMASLLLNVIGALAFATVALVLAVLAATRPPAPMRTGPARRLHTEPTIATLQERSRALLAALPEASLPEAMAADLRNDLADLEDRLGDLGDTRIRLRQVVEGAQEESTRKALTRALTAGDTAAVETHRAALARLDEVHGHLETVDAEIRDVGQALDRLDVALAAPEARQGEGPADALVRIGRSLDALKAAHAELDDPRARAAAATAHQKATR